MCSYNVQTPVACWHRQVTLDLMLILSDFKASVVFSSSSGITQARWIFLVCIITPFPPCKLLLLTSVLLSTHGQILPCTEGTLRRPKRTMTGLPQSIFVLYMHGKRPLCSIETERTTSVKPCLWHFGT